MQQMPKSKIWLRAIVCFILCAAMLLIFAAGSCMLLAKPVSAEAGYTSAKAMCVMEGNSGRVLYTKNASQQLPMASTTKIMTAITALEHCQDLDTRFEISPRAVGVSGTSIYLRKGEMLSLRELLYGLMLVSGNDASVAIGEHVSGSVEAFVELMNETAQNIGATNSHFDNTHGLDSKTHYTTAKDLALITSYALKNDTFRTIVSTKNTKIDSEAGKTRYLKNKNKLLNSLDGCVGVKTGFTDDAGRCLVSAAERDNMRLVCVVLNCGPMFEESSALIEKGFNEYTMIDVTCDYSFNPMIPVFDGRKSTVRVGTQGKFVYPFKKAELKDITYIYDLPKQLVCPIVKDTEVGNVQVYFGNNLLFKEKIVTMEDIRGNTVWEKLKDVLTKW